MLRLTFDRQLLLSLLLVALVPLGVFALVAFPRFSSSVRAESAQGAADAVGSVRTLIEQLDGRLSATTSSYATWETVADLVDRLDGQGLETDVAGFLVDRGTADSVVVLAGATDLAAAGGDPDRAALATIARTALAADPDPAEEIGPGVATLPSGINVVSVRRIDLGDRTGPGAEAARDGGAAIATARRLDGGFAIDAAQLTGFAVSFHLPDGALSVTSDADAAAAVGAPGISPTDPGAVVIRDVGGYASGSAAVVDRAGDVVGIVAASARLNVLNAIDEELLPILWLGLLLSSLAAVSLAILLSRRLRRRLDAVAAGIVAVSQGDTSVQLPTGGDDGIARLAASHNHLAAALARRDTALNRSLGAVAALTPDRGTADLAAAGTRAAVAVFGLRSAQLVDVDGTVIATDDPGPAPGTDGPIGPDADAIPGSTPGPTVDVPVTPRAWRLVARLAPGQEWSDADAALLALYARQLGAALRDAQLYADAAERAAELERVNRMQGDFLRGVGHNLQTPLTRIEVAASELRDTHPDDPSVARDTRVIRTEGERLSRLVAQLLTLSRLEAHALAVAAEPISIAPIVRRVAPAAVGRDVAVVDEAPGLVPIADEAAVEQVLWMLLDNAARYAPDGPILVRISPAPPDPFSGVSAPGTSDGGSRVAVAVEDSGPGVPPAERERIFARFTRGSTSEDTDGTGLGLDVARGLVTAMGGTIRCEAAPGGGARFVFTLPAEDATVPA